MLTPLLRTARPTGTAGTSMALHCILALSILLAGCDVFGSAVDERAPRVEIIRPFDEAVVSGKNVLISVSAEALGTDNFISFININVNGQRAGEAEYDGTNFQFRLNTFELEDGLYRVEAVAFDKFQARGISSPIILTVENESAGPGPRMTIVDPEEQDEIAGFVRVVARTDPGEPFVTRVDLLIDGVPTHSSTDAIGGDTFIFDWDATASQFGEHAIEVKAFSGPNVFRISDAITVLRTAENDSTGSRPGTVAWRGFGFKGEVEGSPAVGFNGDIYIATSSDTLYTYTSDGILKWKFATRGPLRSSPVIGNNEDVFIASEDGRFYGLTSQGSNLWGAATSYNAAPGLLRAAPALGVDGAFYFGDTEGRLHAVNSFDGLKASGNWPRVVANSSVVVPPVIARDHTVFVASTDGRVTARLPDGTKLWTSSTLGSIRVGMALAERDITITLPTGETRTRTITVVYVVSDSGRIYALSGEDGSQLWSYRLNGPLRSAPIVGPDGAIYVGTSTGLIALNEEADSFTPRLRFVFVANDVGTPAIDSNEVVYFVGGETLYAINPNGTPAWTYELETESDGPLTIDRSGLLLVAGNNNVLYAINTGSVGLAPEKWPMYQRNARHTGRIGIDATDG